VVGHGASAGGIHERLQFLSAWAALPDLTGPHGDLRGLAGAGGALVDDLAREGHDLVEGAGVRVGGHGRSAVAWADWKLRSSEKTYSANASRWRAVPVRLRCKPLQKQASVPISALPQRTLLWISQAAGVTAGFDGTVHGRMYSGPVHSCACLTMQAPVWYPISPGP